MVELGKLLGFTRPQPPASKRKSPEKGKDFSQIA